MAVHILFTVPLGPSSAVALKNSSVAILTYNLLSSWIDYIRNLKLEQIKSQMTFFVQIMQINNNNITTPHSTLNPFPTCFIKP